MRVPRRAAVVLSAVALAGALTACADEEADTETTTPGVTNEQDDGFGVEPDEGVGDGIEDDSVGGVEPTE